MIKHYILKLYNLFTYKDSDIHYIDDTYLDFIKLYLTLLVITLFAHQIDLSFLQDQIKTASIMVLGYVFSLIVSDSIEAVVILINKSLNHLFNKKSEVI